MKKTDIDNANEVWRDIPGYEGLYQISSLGRVKSLSRKVARGSHLMSVPEKIMKQSMAANGYFVVNLNNQGYKTHYVHRLIAESYIENPNALPCIDHINADRTDNRIENLRWCTVAENNRNPITRKRMSEGSMGAVLTEEHKKKLIEASSKPIQQKKNGTLIRVWPSASQASKSLGICGQTICRCCNHPERSKTAGGFEWSYC